MDPLLKSFAGAAVRWLMVFAGAHGINIGIDQANTLINAALIIAPLVWSLVHKVKVNTAIKDAKAGL